jgi:hypothetical protein
MKPPMDANRRELIQKEEAYSVIGFVSVLCFSIGVHSRLFAVK